MLHIKRLYRILWITALSFLVMVALVSTLVSTLYEAAVIRFLKSYLDNHLRTQITVDDIRFKAIKGFPDATFELKNIVILSGEDFSASLRNVCDMPFYYEMYKMC